MRYLAILAVLFLAACGDSGGPAGNAPSGAAGEGAAGIGAAGAGTGMGGAAGMGADDMCKALSACANVHSVGKAQFSSPTCPGRLCGECRDINGIGVHDCYVEGSSGSRVYCDNRGFMVDPTDCN